MGRLTIGMPPVTVPDLEGWTNRMERPRNKEPWAADQGEPDYVNPLVEGGLQIDGSQFIWLLREGASLPDHVMFSRNETVRIAMVEFGYSGSAWEVLDWDSYTSEYLVRGGLALLRRIYLVLQNRTYFHNWHSHMLLLRGRGWPLYALWGREAPAHPALPHERNEYGYYFSHQITCLAGLGGYKKRFPNNGFGKTLRYLEDNLRNSIHTDYPSDYQGYLLRTNRNNLEGSPGALNACLRYINRYGAFEEVLTRMLEVRVVRDEPEGEGLPIHHVYPNSTTYYPCGMHRVYRVEVPFPVDLGFVPYLDILEADFVWWDNRAAKVLTEEVVVEKNGLQQHYELEIKV